MVALALKLLSKYWPYLVGAALLYGAYLYVDSKGYERAELKKNIEIAQIEKAGAQAELEAWKQKDKAEKKYEEFAQKADADRADLSRQYNAALLRYAQAGAGKASPAPKADATALGNGPGDSPKLSYERVEISYEDAQICADNTARLQSVRTWGLSILADQSTKSETQPIPTETD